MGVYDTVEIGGKTGQVKCWGRAMKTLTIGDNVPAVCGAHTYSIAMREGGFVHVHEGRIGSWEREPLGMYLPVFDKYGEEFTEQTQGELAEVLDDPYFFP